MRNINIDKKYIALLVIIVVLIGLVILALRSNDIHVNTNIYGDKGSSGQVNIGNNMEIIESDVEFIEGIIQSVNTSDIQIISNRHNGQADIILDNLNINVNDLYAYAGAIDPKFESVYAVFILRPKEDKVSEIQSALRMYLYGKQLYYINNNLTDTDEYRILSNTINYSTDKYIVMVMSENANDILLDITKALEDLGDI